MDPDQQRRTRLPLVALPGALTAIDQRPITARVVLDNPSRVWGK